MMHLDQTQIRRFEEDGILFFPGLLDPGEVAELRAELPEILAMDRPEILREKHSSNVRCAFAPHTYSEGYRRLMQHPDIVGPVAQLLGGSVYLHQFSINPKAAFVGEAWGWHQDYPTWRVENRIARPDLVVVGVYLDEVTEFNGPLFFILGSHRRGVLDIETDATSTSYTLLGVSDEDVAELCRNGRLYSPLGPAGSVWMFHCNIVHGSNANMSPSRRALCTISYNRTDNLPSAHPRPEWEAHSEFTPVEARIEHSLGESGARSA